MNKNNDLLRSSLLSVLSLLVCLIVLELVFRGVSHREKAELQAANATRMPCTIKSEFRQLVYTFPAKKCEMNSRGYRGGEHSLAKPENTYRIVVVGDSVAQGQGVKLENTFSRVLERELNDLTGLDGMEVEVVVLARSGYAMSQELFLLEHEAFNYGPDLILWSYVLNDPSHAVFGDANGKRGRYFYEPRSHVYHFISRKVFEIREKQAGKVCPPEYHAFLHCAYRDNVLVNLKLIGELARQSGVPVLFAIHPVYEQVNDFSAYSLTEVHRDLFASASGNGLEALDLLEAHKKHQPRELAQALHEGIDPWHPNARGNEVIAGAIYRFILDKGFLDHKLATPR